MAAATVNSAAEGSCTSHRNHHRLHTEALPLIDLRLLSQPELLSLSLCSSSSPSHLKNDTDISTTNIDGSVFNESAGSRKQTFSRLRLAPPRNYQFLPPNHHHHHHHQQQQQQDLQEDQVEENNSQIISLIGSLFGFNSIPNSNDDPNDEKRDDSYSHNNLISVPVCYTESNIYTGAQNVPVRIADTSSEVSSRRKRGRPRKNENCVSQIINVSNNESNRVTLSKNEHEDAEEDPIGLGLRRRMEEMRSEAELLGFLEGVEGEWMSARKKRKIVDAGAFGDSLPRGWKLMVCVKKRAGYMWLENQRYIRFFTICFMVHLVLFLF